MASSLPSSAPIRSSPGAPPRSYTPALSALTVLFFMMGFITCLNDTLLPYLKAIFSLSYWQANFINAAYFGAYLLMSLPAGLLVARLGYKQGMLLGFVVAALGCALFWPAASARSYAMFLGALLVLASGITMLQVAGNPYVAVLGPPESSSARLTLTQAFNSLGTTIAPILGAELLLARLPKLDPVTGAVVSGTLDVRAVQIPYAWLAGAFLLISAALMLFRLPAIHHEEATPAAPADGRTSAWQYPHLLLGALAIFTYVGAEVAIGSHIANYLNQPSVMGMDLATGGRMLAFYWGGAMVGRFIGAATLRYFNPGRQLALHCVGAIVLVILAAVAQGSLSMWALLAVGFCNSIMFATIFTLAVAGLGRHTDQGSGILCTAIVGGAVIPLLFGALADAYGLRLALALPVVCYAYIIWYGLRQSRAANLSSSPA